MTAFYLNSYKPLVCSHPGRLACKEHALQPFIDGSIRREPDLEHDRPSISCLCRAGKFAPRLERGNVVGYMTTKVRFGTSIWVRRLTALLQVDQMFDGHDLAAKWYRENGFALPSNCMVSENAPEPLSESHCIHDGHVISRTDDRSHRRWDAQYRLRASQFPRFLVCQRVFLDVSENAPLVADETLISVFGRPPGTQNPGKLPRDQFCRFLDLVGIDVSLPAP